MKYQSIAFTAALCISAPAAAEPHLVLRLIADEHVIAPGDSVHWQLWAELIEPESEIVATVVDISFSLTFGGDQSISITENDFSSAFDSLIFGPADDGIVDGDTISGAFGVNVIPPINDPGGPDSSNPLFIYGFTMVHDGSIGEGIYQPELTIESQLTGAYASLPFPDYFFYRHRDGTSDVPFVVIADTVYNIPTPATGTLALLGLSALRRRSR